MQASTFTKVAWLVLHTGLYIDHIKINIINTNYWDLPFHDDLDQVLPAKYIELEKNR